MREFARARSANVRYVPLRSNLQLDDAEAVLTQARGNEKGLFGFPAQSNFSGIRHPLTLVFDAQRLGYRVLLDAAAFLPTSKLSLSTYPADFVALSIYKITGYPTGVGALVARRDAIAELERPWFAGGTVEYASIQHDAHLLKNRNGEGFEDGTPAFLSISAVNDGLEFLDEIGMDRVTWHVESLSREFIERLRALRKRDGRQLAIIYGDGSNRGGTVAFNLLDSRGHAIPFGYVVDRARNEGVSLRGGCFCNPGASEVAFNFPSGKFRKCLANAADNGYTIERVSRCLGADTAVGAVRASMGIPTNRRDIARALSVIATFA
jgi:selenocysteine lyase/cysteine desulfurase